MDVIGTISELDKEDTWQKTHLIGLRADVWRPDPKEVQRTLRILKDKRRTEIKKSIRSRGRLNQKQEALLEQQSEIDSVLKMSSQDLESRRLVLKLFKMTPNRVRWCGTIEEVTTAEVHNSIGSRRNLLTMLVTLPNTQLVTRIQENHRTFRYPSIFSFCYIEKDRAYHVSLKQRWVSLGPDFDIWINGKDVGIVDGKLMCLGSDSYVDLEDHELAEDTRFIDLLTLFAASIGYHKAMRKSTKRRIAATLSGNGHYHIIEDEEIRLRHNGRAAA